MSQPKVSVIVPAYKMEAYVCECLDSILKQTLSEIEVIIVDEGDSDRCREIIDEYEFGLKKDVRVKTIHEKNGGYGASMNKGISYATGEYIGIVEADDFVNENMFADLYKLARDNDADIVKSDFYFYTTANNQSRKAGKISKAKCGSVYNVSKDASILKIMPTIWTAIYKREFLINNDIRFLETKGGSYQDTSFAFKTLSLAQRVLFTDKAYLHYRIDNDFASTKSLGKVYAICDEYGELTRFVNGHPDIKSLVNQIKLINQWNAYIWNLKRIDEQFISEFVDKFSEEFKSFYEKGELGQQFFKKINKKTLLKLINDKESFKKHIHGIIMCSKKRGERSKMFSVHINSSRISIILFGKQVIAINL